MQSISLEVHLERLRVIPNHTYTKRKLAVSAEIKVLYLNCNSIPSQHKSGLFKAKIEDEKPHITIGTESKRESEIVKYSPVTMKYFVDRKGVNPGGGVFIAVYNTIISTQQSQPDCQAEAIWIKIEITNQKPLCIASLYRPPGSNNDPLDTFKLSRERLQSNGSFPRVIVARDMDVPDIDWIFRLDIKP